MLQITALYAGALGILSVALGINVGRKRLASGVSILHGDDMDLALAMRKHGNLTEWVPMALILIAVLELNGVGLIALHALGAVLLISRVAHAVGLRADTLEGVGRAVGAGGTTLVTVVASIWAILTFF